MLVALGGRESVEEIGAEEADARCYVVDDGVCLGNAEGFGGQIERGDVRVGEIGGECDGDGSGTGADVGERDGVVVREAMEDGFDEVLGLGARDEDGWGDA